MSDHKENDMSDQKSDDDMFDQIKDAAEAVGFTVASEEELAGVVESMERAKAERDDQAKAEGRRFLTEEQDGELIEMWWKDAAACRSIDDATVFARRLLTDYRHDYGTICHAIGAGSLAMAWGMNGEPEGGITGFQSGFVMWGFVQHWMSLEGQPLRLVQYNDLLYPQSDHKFTELSSETATSLVAKAKELLAEERPHGMSDVVRQRWEEIATGEFPSFVTVESS